MLTGEKKMFWLGVFETSRWYRWKAKLVLLEDTWEEGMSFVEERKSFVEDRQRDPLLGRLDGDTQ